MQQGEQSSVLLRIVRVRDGRIWKPSAGRATLTVNGRLKSVQAGDEIRVFALAGDVGVDDLAY